MAVFRYGPYAARPRHHRHCSIVATTKPTSVIVMFENPVVVGALIAFAGSVLGSAAFPWLRGAIDRRTDFERERRHAIRADLHELLDAMTHMRPIDERTFAKGGAMSVNLARQVKAVFGLTLSLRRSEAEILAIARSSSAATNHSKEVGTVCLTAAMLVLPAWLRGEIGPRRARRVYEEMTGIPLELDVIPRFPAFGPAEIKRRWRAAEAYLNSE